MLQFYQAEHYREQNSSQCDYGAWKCLYRTFTAYFEGRDGLAKDIYVLEKWDEHAVTTKEDSQSVYFLINIII